MGYELEQEDMYDDDLGDYDLSVYIEDNEDEEEPEEEQIIKVDEDVYY